MARYNNEKKKFSSILLHFRISSKAPCFHTPSVTYVFPTMWETKTAQPNTTVDTTDFEMNL